MWYYRTEQHLDYLIQQLHWKQGMWSGNYKTILNSLTTAGLHIHNFYVTYRNKTNMGEISFKTPPKINPSHENGFPSLDQTYLFFLHNLQSDITVIHTYLFFLHNLRSHITVIQTSSLFSHCHFWPYLEKMTKNYCRLDSIVLRYP